MEEDKCRGCYYEQNCCKENEEERYQCYEDVWDRTY